MSRSNLFKNRRKHLSLCLGRSRNMSANKPPTEQISRKVVIARSLRVIYLPAKYEENRKPPFQFLPAPPKIQRKEVMPATRIANSCIPSGLDARSDFSGDAARR